MTSPSATVRQSLLAVLAYAAALLGTIAWTAANDSAYHGLQAQYGVKSEMLDGLKVRAPADAGTNPSRARHGDRAAVVAPTETMAASALQRYLLDRLESAGGAVQSVQAEPKRETMPPGLQRLGAQLAFDASVAGLQQFLFDLETGLPFVFVDSLTAQPASTLQPGARTGDRLRVTLTVSSYWKAGTGADQ